MGSASNIIKHSNGMALPQPEYLPSIDSLGLDDDDLDDGEEDEDDYEDKDQDQDLDKHRAKKDTTKHDKENDTTTFNDENINPVDDYDDIKLPKDVGEINIKGLIRFDNEMPPDEETKNNTIHNAMMYQLTPTSSNLLLPSDDENNGRLMLSPHTSNNEMDDNNNKFKKSVGFDTFTNNNDISKYQFTLISKHEAYLFSRISRTLMVGYDEQKSSLDALKWAIDEMINDHDTLVCLRVMPLDVALKIGIQNHRKDGEELIKKIENFNKIHNKKIKIVFEMKIGNAQYMITKAMKDYDPSFLIVGTKGIVKQGLIKSLVTQSKSLSKYYLTYSNVPVIVVNQFYQPPKDILVTRDDKTFYNLLRNYPSVYNPELGQKNFDMERSISQDSSSSSGSVRGRTPRFLRIGGSSSRSSSKGTNDSKFLSPSRSRSESVSRGFSPSRALSPLRLLKKTLG